MIKISETVLVMAAHSDDQVIGMGGTIAKYSKEGSHIVVVIFTSGERSSPWLKKDVIQKERIEESIIIDRYLGCKETIFLNVPDGKVRDKLNDKRFILDLARIINNYKPGSIFTHSRQDPHPDHNSVHELVIKTLDIIDKKKKIGVYVFEIWNIVNEIHPRIYVDVSKTFWKKIKAMKMFKSQKIFVYALFIQVMIRAFFSGFHAKCRYAERFYKIR